jgi:hypothetical protein
MRKTLLTSVAVLGLTAGTALAQTQDIRPGHVPGVGDSEPASTQASNINGSDARSPIAPRLPTPAGGPGEDARDYIRDARQALAHHRSGEAQQAIEMAETRTLDRSVLATDVNTPDQNPRIMALEAARQDLAKHNWSGADRHLSEALMQTASADTAMPGTPAMSGATAPSSPGSTAPGEAMGMQPSAGSNER